MGSLAPEPGSSSPSAKEAGRHQFDDSEENLESRRLGLLLFAFQAVALGPIMEVPIGGL